MALTDTQLRSDVLAGLSQPRKSLPCKYLYDERGARLFEAICDLEEYYPTRTELGILRRHAAEIAALVGPAANLVDLGSGSGLKTRLLLEALDRPASYRPVDVARSQLLDYAARVARDYPGLRVEPICADYTEHFDLPPAPVGSGRTVFFFPGSTIGNFEPEDAWLFLLRLRRLCPDSSVALVGVDLKKEPQVLHRAYNDGQGVTAKFNLNLLARINLEVPARFKLSLFRHRALYNEALGRVEMHLVSRRRQLVPVDRHTFAFDKGESIVTEHCYKYTLQGFERLASHAGLQVARQWTDEQQWFSVQYLTANNGAGRAA